MAQPDRSSISAVPKLKGFCLETLAIFGVVTVLKAAMVPHALSSRPGTHDSIRAVNAGG